MKIVIFVGTRPEAIKLAPVYLEFKRQSIDVTLVSTGQHRSMLDQIFAFFKIEPDLDLNVMSENQSLSQLTAILCQKIDEHISKNSYDLVLVQGDTTTCMVGSLVAYYHKIPVGHVEAGLRSYDKFAPFPEEVNRKMTSSIADIHFAPTEKAKDALGFENISDQVYVVGNTVIDSLLVAKKMVLENNELYKNGLEEMGVSFSEKIILITGHRRESFGHGFEEICQAIQQLAEENPEFNFVYPVHLNPNVKDVVASRLSGYDNILLLKPLAYDYLVYLLSHSYLVMTDSGGIQEEAPALDLPVVVMREKTERPEGVDAGCAVIGGVDKSRLVSAFNSIIKDCKTYEQMSCAKNPYGDGQSSRRIVEIVTQRVKGG